MPPVLGVTGDSVGLQEREAEAERLTGDAVGEVGGEELLWIRLRTLVCCELSIM